MSDANKRLAAWLRHHAESLTASDAALIRYAAVRLEGLTKHDQMLLVMDGAIAAMQAIKQEKGDE